MNGAAQAQVAYASPSTSQRANSKELLGIATEQIFNELAEAYTQVSELKVLLYGNELLDPQTPGNKLGEPPSTDSGVLGSAEIYNGQIVGRLRTLNSDLRQLLNRIRG